ncbi:MAG: response regulator [Candidatus Gastranaerophilales bacterium]|nr:response regulator [Candidatus Gastranaerophilales bacterium]
MRFLVVDDSYDWLKFHRDNIRITMPEAQIELAASAYEGLKKVQEHDANYYDFILSDMQMEDVDSEIYAGIWFIKQVLGSKKAEKSKIIVISAVYNISEVARNLNVNYISKSSLISSPSVFEYKLKELLKL